MVKRSSAILASFAAATFGCSCSGSESGGPAALVVDSAGLRLVSYDLTEVDAPVFRSVGEPDLEIGLVDGEPEYAFSGVVDVALLDDGRIVVSDAVSKEIRIFDAQGRYQRSIGQEGEGPGEFVTAPSIVGLSIDTLFAYDAGSGRVSSFTAEGRFLSTVSVSSGTGNRIPELTRKSDGSYLAQSRWVAPDQAAVLHDVRLELDSVVVEHMTASGNVIDTMKVMADRNRARMVQDGGGGRLSVMQAQAPYTPRAFLRTVGPRVVIGRSDSFELELAPGDGLPTLLRVFGVDHPATAAEIRSRQEARVREAMGERPLDPRTRRLTLDCLPERLPAFAAVSLSATGDIWVALTEFDASEGYDWLVFSPAGELRGVVHTPPTMRLMVVRPTFIIGVVTDELDVPYVRRYPLMAPDVE
jgi:hypothetical protein